MMDSLERTGFTEEYWANHDKSAEAYRNLLQSFKSNGTLMATNYPEHYGGCYINRAGKLVIYVIGNVDTGRSDFAKRTKDDNIIVKTGRHSFRTLTETMNKLNLFKEENPTSSIAENFNYYALMDAENIVVVELDTFSQQHINEFKEAVSSASCIEFAHSSGKSVDDLTVNPGDSISSNAGGGSMGYRVRRSGNDGFLTAAHVATSTASGSNDIKVGNTVVAQATNRQQSGSVDAAFCQLNSPHTASNSLGGGTLSTDVDTPSSGQWVNMRGATSGTVSGLVISTNVSGTWSGISFSNLTSAGYTRAGGDSGGVVYTYYSSTGIRNTCGIHKGATSDGDAVYCKAASINTALSTSRY